MMTSTLPSGMLGFVASLLASTLYEGKHKVLNIASIEGYVRKTQIDAQPLIDVQSSNRHPMTYVLNNVTPVRAGF